MSALKGLTGLGSRASLYTPDPSSFVPGQLIIICSWADAARQHIARYLDLHKSIAPGAQVLLIQTAALHLVSPYSRQQASLKPVVRFILDHLEAATERQTESKTKELKILLHSFSNGGGLTATQLFFLLREATNAPLTLVGIIMDSSPDGGTYRQTHNAIVVGQPRSKLQKIGISLLAHAVLIPIWISYAVGRDENSQTLMRRVFLDQDLVGTTNICYFYSKTDQMTNWRDVRTHADEARRMGWAVDELEFHGSSHCAHIGVDKERYTAAVRKMWDGMTRRSKI
ncbi:putative DUF829 domain protein [Talaromyces proteolyticus]|uniref:DUF829 domain protein n=1 Tax=Talaromyces proteolyticus TaxID=1131652 RepID=A0AAD4KRN7_9EURO|nr:putative DUF829 domain protein [Talaromyces proteolyticus]KAH8695027.1 putative DUF829 domain protein [Talaromyces proteolyticus]